MRSETSRASTRSSRRWSTGWPRRTSPLKSSTSKRSPAPTTPSNSATTSTSSSLTAALGRGLVGAGAPTSFNIGRNLSWHRSAAAGGFALRGAIRGHRNGGRGPRYCHGRGVRAHRLEPVATHSAQDEDGGKGQRNQNRLDRRSTERECRLHLLSPHSGFLTTGAMLGRRQRPLYAGQHIGGVTFVTGPPGSLV